MQITVEEISFESKYSAMKLGVDMVESIRYKLHVFIVPTDSYANVLCDTKAVYKNTITMESVLMKKHHFIDYRRCSEAVSNMTISFSR